MVFKVTLNKNHDTKSRETAQRLEVQHPTDATSVKFVWLTDEDTASHMKRRDLVFPLSNRRKEKTRNRLLGRVEQWSCQSTLRNSSSTIKNMR